MSKVWPKVRLGEVADRVERAETPVPGRKYRQIGVRLWGEGAYERETMDGSQTTYAKLFRAEAGDIIVNKIWARNGSVAVVPSDLAGCHGSGEFPMFTPNPDRLDSQWMHWLTKTRGFWAQCDEKSQGTSGKNRIKPEQFLALEISLPPLPEQKRIVARIEELAGKIEKARGLRRQAVEEAKSIIAGELHRRFVSDENTWQFGTVDDAADIIDPNPSHRMPVYAESGIPFISTVDFVGAEGIRRNTVKHVQVATYKEQVERCAFSIGDILYSRIGTIGAARVLTDIWPFALSHVLVVVKPKATVLPRFLLWYLRSDSIVSQASEATRSVGVPDLGIQRIRCFHMPLPSIPEQRCIIAYLDELQGKVDNLKRLQADTAAELDALLPSVLDKAFKGEL